MDSNAQAGSRSSATGLRLIGRAPECAALDRLCGSAGPGGPGVAHPDEIFGSLWRPHGIAESGVILDGCLTVSWELALGRGVRVPAIRSVRTKVSRPIGMVGVNGA
jgi:hypothetical protein